MASNDSTSNTSASGSDSDSNHTPTKKKYKFSLSPQVLEMRRHNLLDDVHKCKKLIYTLIRLKKTDELGLWEGCLQDAIASLTFMKNEVGKSIRDQNGLNELLHQLNQGLSAIDQPNMQQADLATTEYNQMNADFNQDI